MDLHLWVLCGPVLVVAFLFHVDHKINLEFIDDLLRLGNWLSLNHSFLVFDIAIRDLDFEALVHVPCWMFACENPKFILISLLPVVLKGKVTHGYHPFLLHKNLAWLFLRLVEHIVAKREL